VDIIKTCVKALVVSMFVRVVGVGELTVGERDGVDVGVVEMTVVGTVEVGMMVVGVAAVGGRTTSFVVVVVVVVVVVEVVVSAIDDAVVGVGVGYANDRIETE
jgi:hypothetical protein